ncbi:MAG: 16S rRNA (adenine(1518)-N(6)/adenine(1519)-N(6))-dimethyltransferase RsmA [Lachnospiraceae bacterium]|nr:16S rRNA (adenine(1518)-N(6)/adenine(1519)-N(6))-dimethyltransferase RsmA [Lachnospiraceae bacterium]
MSTGETRKKLESRGFSPNKRFGQNFLTDENVLDGIVDAAGIEPADTVLEIGPGTGALTKRLAKRAAKVIAVEIDRGLAGMLEEEFRDDEHVRIICGDILKTDLGALLKEHAPVKVVANLPYYITTPILLELLPKENLFESFVIMIQKEVADRMSAAPGNKDYGALSLVIQYYGKPRIVMEVPPSAFYPAPEVTSSVVRIDRHETPPVDTKDPDRMFAVIRAAFGKRRKTLANAVSSDPGLEISAAGMRSALRSMGLDEAVRGEALSLSDYAGLCDRLFLS